MQTIETTLTPPSVESAGSSLTNPVHFGDTSVLNMKVSHTIVPCSPDNQFRIQMSHGLIDLLDDPLEKE